MEPVGPRSSQFGNGAFAATRQPQLAPSFLQRLPVEFRPLRPIKPHFTAPSALQLATGSDVSAHRRPKFLSAYHRKLQVNRQPAQRWAGLSPSQTDYEWIPKFVTDHSPDSTLTYKGNAIRLAMLDGVPWFSLTDICSAMSFYGDNAALLSEDLPDHACRDCFAETDTGEKVDATLISPVGVWLLSHLIDPAKFQQIAAWARKEAQRLCPDPQPNDPAMFLTLDSNMELPPFPYKYSGRRAEFMELKENTICERIAGRRRGLDFAAIRRDQALSQAAANPA